VTTAIDRLLGELTERVTLTWKQLRLFRDVLAVQAEESLRSSEAGYASGVLDSLDLLDAERVLLDVRTAVARTRADYAIAVARLEGAVGEPVPATEGASR
jgi:outer membrane protein TolC